MSTIDDLFTSGVIHPVAEVTSWLGGSPLGEVPIAQGTVTETASGDTLGSLEITVPGTKEWIPTHPSHALAAYGQELLVRRGFQLPGGETIGWETLGRFRIRPAEVHDGWVTVQAVSIDDRLNHARWLTSTRTTGTFGQQALQICAGLVPVRVMAPDRAAPARTWEQQTGRRESLLELCDAWGTVPRMVDGQLTIVPVSRRRTAERTIRAGRGGTLVSVAPIADADLVPNVVVASTVPEDETAPLTSMAVIETGPRRWTGPYGHVVRFYASPLLTSQWQCYQAAVTRLTRLQAAGPDVEVAAATDPRIRLDTVIRAIDQADGTDALIRVTEAVHALTAGAEPGGYRGELLAGKIRGTSWL